MENLSESEKFVIIRNIPKNISVEELLENFDIVKFEQKKDFVLVELVNNEIAMEFIRNLHQSKVADNRLDVKFYNSFSRIIRVPD